MHRKEIILLALVALLCLAAGLLASWWITQAQRPAGITSIGGDFNLRAADGEVSLAKDLRGKVVVLYFGFASCPDICPTSLNVMAGALRLLDTAAREQTQAVFVSLDPQRDSVQKLKQYANAFYPGMLGLTADEATIKDVAWRYRAIFKKVPLPDSALGYTIDHTSIIYIIGKNGVVQSLAQHGATVAEVATKIKAAL